MTSGHVREPGAATAGASVASASSDMWRVVVPKPDDGVNGAGAGNTLLSSELTPPPPPPPGAIAVTATSHYQHHHHWPPPPPHPHPHTHHHHPYAIPATLAPQQQHGYGGQHQEAQDGQGQQGQEQQQHHSTRMSVKRQLSDSDCDDVFSEESGKEPCNSPGGDSCQHTSRKRRRGMIEKKRRDRINASLGELRRLVPAAARDPHSGKLEKAEILQLTVEHLRTLKNKGHETGYDSTKLAMDYHAVGWGECAAEVGRYLVTMEGLDERDPLRLRLLSHLQSFHREQPPSQPQQQPQPQGHSQQQSAATSSGPNGYEAQSSTTATTSSAALTAAASGSVQFHHQPPPTLAWPPSGAQYHHNHHHPGAQYPVTAAAAAAQYAQQGHGKPYRPWGAELAY